MILDVLGQYWYIMRKYHHIGSRIVPVVSLFIKEEFLESRVVLILMEKPFVGRGWEALANAERQDTKNKARWWGMG